MKPTATAALRLRGVAWHEGWWHAAVHKPSPNHGPRPPHTVVDMVVIHSISLPPGEYGGDAIDRLFDNTLDPAAHPSFGPLRGLQVSSHFVIRRDGVVQQHVSCDRRAWHAGVSQWGARHNCNDFSVGIELEGLEGDAFDAVQYQALAKLMRALRRRHPLRDVVGHQHIAPGRKGDPGAGFDWAALQQRLRWRGVVFAGLLNLHSVDSSSGKASEQYASGSA